MAIEQPEYTVIRSDGRFELRRYEPCIVAETVVEDADPEAGTTVGFRRLAGFIFGGNRAKESIAMTAPVATARSEKIAMTAPVETQRGGQGMVMTFMMPSRYTLETLPEPIDPGVVIRRVPGRTMAAIRFSGRWGEERFEERTAELLTWVRERNLVVTGTPVVARYNPPWTPFFMRRNEVLVEIRMASQVSSSPG
jgi:effector-binding domain-containing protein